MRYVGYAMVVAPFVAIFCLVAKEMGWKASAAMFGAVVFIVLWFALAARLTQ